MEERLVDIEIRITHQEDLLDTLNQAVYRQQQQLDQLQALCAGLAQRLKEIHQASQAASGEMPEYERPPHY